MPIFRDQFDFRRFYWSLYLFNDSNYSHPGGDPLLKEVTLASHVAFDSLRNPFVKIISFCLLDNHFHLFLQQLQEDGIQNFLKKVSQGHARSFNLSKGRTGPMFESRFKAVLVERESHFLHLARYIHLNALDGTGIPWREGKVADWDLANKRLDSYPWSSHAVYMGHEQDLPIVDIATVQHLFRDADDYQKFLRSWIGRHLLPHGIVDIA